jgi:prolyl-tRNA synthetase
MTKKGKNALSVTRSEDFSEWYQQVIKAADMAENSPVRGCMVIKPWGYAVWENIQRVLDRKFKETGHQNAYFPLFIPKSYLEREAKHVEGFAKECAVVTHSRLEAEEDGGLVPASALDEPLIVRPTSETIIGEMFAKWVKSYRDLPLLINQWANVVRWEMRPRLFLRTAEFLWQEGHTVHQTKQEALEETTQMLGIYSDFCEEYMGMPVIQGEKSESERFPGAETTFCIEAMMQDRKALQAGTSHFLGQNFSKASNISFLDQNGNLQYAWTSSWGVSTRLIGGMIMTHGDDDGMVMPPRLSPLHIVILPVIHNETLRTEVLEYCEKLRGQLSDTYWHDERIRVQVDTRDMRGGEKMWSWIKKGVPVWVEVGPRDIASDCVFVGQRIQGPGKRSSLPRENFVQSVGKILDSIQGALFERAKAFREKNTVCIKKKKDFYDYFTPQNKGKPEIHGGFVLAHWSGDMAIEEQVKKDIKVTIRCIPLDDKKEEGRCVISDRPAGKRALWAKAY